MKRTPIPRPSSAVNENDQFIGPPQNLGQEQKEPMYPSITSRTLKLFDKQGQTASLQLVPARAGPRPIEYKFSLKACTPVLS